MDRHDAQDMDLKQGVIAHDRARFCRGSRIRVIFLFLLVAPWQSLGAEETFELFAIDQDVRLGDRFDVVLKSSDPLFDLDRITLVEFDLDPGVWHLAVPWERIPRRQRKEPAWLWRATLQSFQIGRQTLPSVRVVYRMDGETFVEAEASTATVLVASVLAQGDQPEELVGLRPLYEFPRNWAPVAAGSLAAVAAMLIALLLLRRWIRKRQEARGLIPPEPLLPPGLWALREIDRLSRLDVCREGPVKQIATLASDLVRRYLSRRFGFDALETTTYECLAALRAFRSPRLPQPARDLIRDFLDECDLVKFSKFEPGRDRWSGLWDDARAIVRATTAQEEFAAPSKTALPDSLADSLAKAPAS